jgi:hypothetical protein
MSDPKEIKQEKDQERLDHLYELFLEICDQMIEEAFLVTDGVTVSSVVMDKRVGHLLSKKMKKAYGNEWGVYTIPEAIKYAHEVGYETALMEMYKRSRQQVPPETESGIEGDDSAENSKLRKRELQSEEESD